MKSKKRPLIPIKITDLGDWCRFAIFKRVRNLLLTRDLGEGWDFFLFPDRLRPLRMKYNGDWCKFEIFQRVRNLLLTRDLGEGWDFFFFQTDCDRSVLDVRD